MKTKLFLLTAVLAVAAAQGAANPTPKWAGDHPGSFMNRQTDPLMAAMIISETEKEAQAGRLSPQQLAEHKANKAEYNAYFDWAQSQR